MVKSFWHYKKWTQVSASIAEIHKNFRKMVKIKKTAKKPDRLSIAEKIYKKQTN